MKENPIDRKEKLTIDLAKANLYALYILFAAIVFFAVPYFLIWKDQFNKEHLSSLFPSFPEFFLYLFLILLGGIIIHELIHGITWAFFARRGFKSIRFGVLWKMLTPYCHCKEALQVRSYVLGALMPGLILGILPSLIAILLGELRLLLFGIFFTMAAAGDFMVITLLRKEKQDYWVEDHPNEAGCYIYRNKNFDRPSSDNNP